MKTVVRWGGGKPVRREHVGRTRKIARGGEGARSRQTAADAAEQIITGSIRSATGRSLRRSPSPSHRNVLIFFFGSTVAKFCFFRRPAPTPALIIGRRVKSSRAFRFIYEVFQDCGQQLARCARATPAKNAWWRPPRTAWWMRGVTYYNNRSVFPGQSGRRRVRGLDSSRVFTRQGSALRGFHTGFKPS